MALKLRRADERFIPQSTRAVSFKRVLGSTRSIFVTDDEYRSLVHPNNRYGCTKRGLRNRVEALGLDRNSITEAEPLVHAETREEMSGRRHQTQNLVRRSGCLCIGHATAVVGKITG